MVAQDAASLVLTDAPSHSGEHEPVQDLDVWSLLALSGLLGITLCLSIALKLGLEGRMVVAASRYGLTFRVSINDPHH